MKEYLCCQFEEETELRDAFKKRWTVLNKKGYTKEERIKLWYKVIQCYKGGFRCRYCGVKMKIKGGPNAFSIEHPDNDLLFPVDNLEIICLGCNFFKRSISKDNFLKLISTLLETHGMPFYQELKNEIYVGIQKGLHQAQAKGKICHRPRKEINMDRVERNIRKGLYLEQIAIIEKVSYATLQNRLREKRDRNRGLKEG